MLSFISKAKALQIFAVAAICVTLFSFSSRKGGEMFEVYLNNKLLIQQHINATNTVKSIQVDPASGNDELKVKYFHCGQIGKDRTITIKDAQNKTVKQFRFADSEKEVAISCKVKDFASLLKPGTQELKLYYAAKELPAGKLLASLTTAGRSTASR